MPHKKWCNKCENRHYPPTGKKCVATREQESHDTSVESGAEQNASPVKKMKGKSTTSKQKNAAEDVTQPEHQVDVQSRILEQLQRVNDRLDAMEDKVEEVTKKEKDRTKLSKKVACKKVVTESSDSSDEFDSSDSSSSIPSIDTLRKSKKLQKQVDCRLRKLEKAGQKTGNETEKFKSKRGGGPVEVIVKNKVAWPHEAILGGVNRTRVTYDQLNVTQWVQGFCRNIMDEKDERTRFQMIQYMSELMEDATDFSWQGAKAAHAVLLCEFERGSITWGDTNRIERVRRAHAQKHQGTNKNWSKSDQSKKPWFCRFFQNGTCQYQKDHEYNGKLQRHVCAYCLSQGKTMGHAEKDCTFAKKNPKND